jgi:hypothetical protein
MSEYFANLLEILEEMDKFLDAFDLPKLDTNHFNRSITIKGTEAVRKSFPTKKSPGSD